MPFGRRPFHLHEGELREAKNRQLAAALHALVLNVAGRRARARLVTNSMSDAAPSTRDGPFTGSRGAGRARVYWQVA
jgi:hypothetical protein